MKTNIFKITDTALSLLKTQTAYRTDSITA